MGSQMQEKSHGSRENPESEVFERSQGFRKAARDSIEGSKEFRRETERSGKQPDLQEDRTRSEGQLRAQEGSQIFRGPAKSSVGQEGGLRFSRASRGSTGQSEVPDRS